MTKDWKNSFLDVIEVVMNGLKGQEHSWSDKKRRYRKSIGEAANEFMGLNSDNQLGYMAEIFAHWSNDVQDMAEYFGFTFTPEGEIVRPSDNYVPIELEPTDKFDPTLAKMQLVELDEEDEA